MKIDKKAYINSYDCVCCAGNNSEELFDSICNQAQCISIDTSYVKEKKVAIGKIKSNIPFNNLLKNKCKEILKKSDLKDFSETFLIVASSVGGMLRTEEIYFKENSYKNINPKEHPIDAIAYELKKEFSFYDDISFSTACTSSANALGYAKEVISKGIYKNVLVVAADSLSSTTVNGFASLGVLSSNSCKPFDINRDGMNVSEAIAVILVQDKENNDSIEICGVGYSSDAHHMTQPHPEGAGAIIAMKNAILDAKVEISDISYINAHGTGTMANDLSEIKAINHLFKDSKPYVSSTKSVTGHTLGVAGSIEAIISCMIIKKQIVPTNKDLEEPEVKEINYSLKNIEKEVAYVLSNSFAFGGNNTSLVFGVTK